jgi:hypothetical protein
MSDDETMKAGGGGNPEDDISLPKSTVHKLVAGNLVPSLSPLYNSLADLNVVKIARTPTG